MITVGDIELNIPFVNSKKERRAIVNHIVDKMKRSNISVIDNSGEYSHEALIAFTFVRSDNINTNKTIEKIENILFEKISDECFEISYETI